MRSEIARIVGFWTQLGVDGFRVDAVPFLISPPGAADETDPHAFLRELHRFVGRRRGDAVLLGEVGLPQQEQLAYFGESQAELDLQFDFETAQAIFLALVRGDARPVAESLRRRPPVDVRQGWVTFLRNHDELSLEMLAPDERDEVFQALAPDERQRVYGRGIVRRLAPMLRGDPRRIRLAYSLMFSLPGAPMLFYGEEIGMGELEGRGDRRAVRTPMQWRNARNGGFSDAKPSRLVREIPDGGYGVAHVNVHDQLRAPSRSWASSRRSSHGTAPRPSSPGGGSRCTTCTTRRCSCTRCAPTTRRSSPRTASETRPVASSSTPMRSAPTCSSTCCSR